MYISGVLIENIRSISEISWFISPAEFRGWHVMLGDNSTGKSTFVRSIALCMMKENTIAALRQDYSNWLKQDEREGSVFVVIEADKTWDKFVGRNRIHNQALSIFQSFVRHENNTVFLIDESKIRKHYQQNGMALPSSDGSINYTLPPEKHIWSGKPGWFSASYGPFRRFTGGDKDYEKLFYSHPRLAAHLSAFDESVALTECLQWLKDLDYKRLSGDPEGELLETVKAFVNQEGFLPHKAQLTEVSPKGVTFTDGNGYKIAIEELSDGYRSVLSMTFELIRQMVNIYQTTKIFSKDNTQVIVPGVVLIDEIDAHLHPTWQRRIGFWLTDHFPQIQFIVTTHSPLICQAAERGTIFRLPRPGTDEKAEFVTGIERDRLIYGNILDAYGTGVFGDNITRSESSKKMLRRLAELNRKELHTGLTDEEMSEQTHLRATLPTTANATETK